VSQPLRLVTALLSAALGAACVPHMDQRAPAIQGAVRDGTTPVPGAAVTLVVNAAHAGSCDGGRTVRTDAAGTFVFPASTEFSMAFAMGDRMDRWTLCVDAPPAERIVWTGDGMWGGPQRLVLRCSLARHAPADQGGDVAAGCH